MIPWALDFASAMAAGEEVGPKKRRRRVPTKAMVGGWLVSVGFVVVLRYEWLRIAKVGGRNTLI